MILSVAKKEIGMGEPFCSQNRPVSCVEAFQSHCDYRTKIGLLKPLTGKRRAQSVNKNSNRTQVHM